MIYLKDDGKPILENNGESRDCRAIEATVQELSNREIGTQCGYVGNTCFKALTGFYGSRRVRGWYDPLEKVLCGMIHIECVDESDAEVIENLANDAGGCLRPNGKSGWNNFYEFENE